MAEKMINIDNGQSLSSHIIQKQDIVPLAKLFVRVAEKQLGTDQKELSRDAEDFLRSNDWEGDEKELELTVKRACILSEEPVLHSEDFDIKQHQIRSIGKFMETKLKGFMKNIKSFEKFDLYNMVIPEVEKALIVMVIKETRGNQIKASQLLGINRNTLRSKIKKLGIKIKR